MNDNKWRVFLTLFGFQVASNGYFDALVSNLLLNLYMLNLSVFSKKELSDLYQSSA